MTLINAFFVAHVLAVLILGAAWGCFVVLVIRGVRGYRDRFRNRIF
jgi:hypothetical protein